MAKTLLVLAGIPALLYCNAFVTMKYWTWFVVPVTGWEAVNMWQAVGLLLVVGWMTRHLQTVQSKPDSTAAQLLIAQFFITVICFVGGYVVASFI